MLVEDKEKMRVKRTGIKQAREESMKDGLCKEDVLYLPNDIISVNQIASDLSL